MKRNSMTTQGGRMKSLHFLSFLVIAAAWFAMAPLVQSAETAEGKFHLVYVVTVPDLDKKAFIKQESKESYGPVTKAAVAIGAEVSIEPGLLTDGTRLVFAFDYCRHNYPQRNHSPGRRQHEEQIAIMQVAPEDRADLAHYCMMEEFSLKGDRFAVLDNGGVRVQLSDANFKPGAAGAEPYGGLSSPERFSAVIAGIDGTPAEKMPVAQQAQQPYVFMMSRNRALLEQVVPIAKVKEGEAKSFLARLERYKEKRKIEDPKGKKDICGSYIHDGQVAKTFDLNDKSWWGGLSDEPPTTAEVLYADFDGDGQIDMYANLMESKRQTMVRTYSGAGTERCAVRASDLNLRPLFRPATVLRTGNCVFAYANRYELATNSWQRIVPIQGTPEKCHHHDVLRWYERH